jgi:NADH dehydrogenase
MILITGASGFLGRRLVLAAVQQGHCVRALVRKPCSLIHLVPKQSLGMPDLETVSRANHVRKRSFLEDSSQTEVGNEGGNKGETEFVKDGFGDKGEKELRNAGEEPGCLIYQGDITDSSTLGGALDGIESVVHAAATTSETAPDESLSWCTNVEGTRNLLEACRAAGVRRWIQISSLSANPTNTSLYGRTKFAADEEVRRSALEWTILQPGTIYGPGSRGLFAKMVRLTSGLPVVPVIGPGTQLMRPIHVDDVALAALTCLDHDLTRGRTYALGGRDVITFNDFLRRLIAAQEQRKPLVHIPLWFCFPAARVLCFFLKNPPVTVDNLVGLRQMAAPDIAAAQRDFGFAPRAFADGLQEVFQQAFRPE